MQQRQKVDSQHDNDVQATCEIVTRIPQDIIEYPVYKR